MLGLGHATTTAFGSIGMARVYQPHLGLRDEAVDYSKQELSLDAEARERLCRRLAAVGAALGAADGNPVGAALGCGVGTADGCGEGTGVGAIDGRPTQQPHESMPHPLASKLTPPAAVHAPGLARC